MTTYFVNLPRMHSSCLTGSPGLWLMPTSAGELCSYDALEENECFIVPQRPSLSHVVAIINSEDSTKLHNATREQKGRQEKYDFPTDLIETSEHLIATVDIPGVTKSQISISVEDGHLKINVQSPSRSVKVESVVPGDSHGMESLQDKCRNIPLPLKVDLNGPLEATFENGTLRIKMPKLQAKTIHLP